MVVYVKGIDIAYRSFLSERVTGKMVVIIFQSVADDPLKWQGRQSALIIPGVWKGCLTDHYKIRGGRLCLRLFFFPAFDQKLKRKARINGERSAFIFDIGTLHTNDLIKVSL